MAGVEPAEWAEAMELRIPYALTVLLSGIPSYAAIIELDTAGDSYAGMNGIVFYIPDPDIGTVASGTNNFLSLQDVANDSDDIEAGFNTSASPQFYASSATGIQDVDTGGTDDLLRSAIPTFVGRGGPLVKGVQYYELALSVQESGGTSGFVTLLEMDVGGHSAAGLADFDLQSGTITDVGAHLADTLRLFNVYGGTNADALLYIPTSLFSEDNFLIYAAFDDASGGDESFAFGDSAFALSQQALSVPEPSSAAFLTVLGLAGLGYRRRQRRRHQTEPDSPRVQPRRFSA